MSKEQLNQILAGVSVSLAGILGAGTLAGTDTEALAKQVAANTQRVERVEEDVKDVEDKTDDDHDAIIRIDENVKQIKESLERLAQ